MGPLGTGFLFVRSESLHKLDVSWVGWGADWGHDLFSEEDFILAETAKRFEFGTRAWPVLTALRTAVEFIESLGIGEISARSRGLAAQLCDRLSELSSVDLLTLRPQTGIVAFRIKARDLRETLTKLWDEDRIALRQAPRYGAIRASLAFCNTEDDIDALVEGLRHMR
jgi:selenocysteine lyase/cysteine desulfurase